MSEAVPDFQAIHDTFRPQIQRYLTHLVGEYEAEDLTQEVFVKVSQALPTFRGESKLSTWIYRIASNAAIDRLRDPSFKRIDSAELAEAPDSSEIEVEDRDLWTGEEKHSVEQQVYLKQRFTCYCDTIKNLPANYRMVVALSELENLAASEIADILGLSVNVVKARLHRGRAKLLQELKKHCRPEDWL
ncbi:MAG: sigma-70 family RNA polymerase sigma factor [Omnitrophica WOR_2 bacterium]